MPAHNQRDSAPGVINRDNVPGASWVETPVTMLPRTIDVSDGEVRRARCQSWPRFSAENPRSAEDSQLLLRHFGL